MSYLTTRRLSFIFFIALVIFAAAQAKPTTQLDRIVAIVNHDLITQQELAQYSDELQTARKQQGLPQLKGKSLQQVALQGLIAQRLEEQEAIQRHITASEAELKHALQTIAKRQHLSLAELRQAVAEQGMPYADYRRQIRQQLILEHLQRQAISPSVHISQQQIMQQLQWLKQQSGKAQLHHIIDIHLSVAEDANNAQRTAIKQRSKQLANTLRTADLATIKNKVNALDNVTLNDLGLRHHNQLPSAFAPIVTKMHCHTLSTPIETDNGFHLIYLVKRQNAQPLPSHEQARRIAYHHEFMKQFKQWLASLKENAYIKIVED